MRSGCRRGETFEGYEVAGGEPASVRSLLARAGHDGIRGNPADPRSGTGLQYARDLQVEKTVEVVRNHEGGTGRDGVAAVARREAVSAVDREWTPAGEEAASACRRGFGEGAYEKDESQERMGVFGSPASSRER
jgi:hypothetical protein